MEVHHQFPHLTSVAAGGSAYLHHWCSPQLQSRPTPSAGHRTCIWNWSLRCRGWTERVTGPKIWKSANTLSDKLSACSPEEQARWCWTPLEKSKNRTLTAAQPILTEACPVGGTWLWSPLKFDWPAQVRPHYSKIWLAICPVRGRTQVWATCFRDTISFRGLTE